MAILVLGLWINKLLHFGLGLGCQIWFFDFGVCFKGTPDQNPNVFNLLLLIILLIIFRNPPKLLCHTHEF